MLLSWSKKESKKGVHLPGTAQMPLKRRATGAPQLLVKDWSITKELAMDRGAWKLAIHVPELKALLQIHPLSKKGVSTVDAIYELLS